MFKINPYRPGAGLMPMYLAGRDEEIHEANLVFEALKMNVPTQSIIYSGLRGVGKTVLINRLQKIAEKEKIFCKHIEVENRNDFISQIAACAQSFLRETSRMEKAKNLVKKTLDAIKSLVISFDPGENSFSLSMQDRELYQSTNLTQSLTEVFTTMGEIAYELEIPVCFFIDEIQYMKQNELGSLVAALHRTNQLGYPVIILGAGLPKIYKMLSDEKTYSERLFSYKEIGSLSYGQAKKAVIEPAKKFNVTFADDAVNKIISITKGYPFFIQQFCQIIYNNVDGDYIEIEHVNNSILEFYNVLDTGFFKVRYERCSEVEKNFVFAMVKCGNLPCSVSNVAKILKRTVKSISPSRGQLISKGIIYPVRYGELDFTVPDFKEFIERLVEYQNWKI